MHDLRLDIPSPPMPAGSHVHAWHLHLQLSAGLLQAAAGVLSLHERHRAEQFRFERDRCRFVAAHAGLRWILAAYLGCRLQEVVLASDPRGKPALAGLGDLVPLRFNLSHSGQYGLLAVAWQREVGADVEQVRSLPDLASLAPSVLSPRELAALVSRDEADKLDCFFAQWTRKEAVAKATGVGLAADLPGIAVEPADPAHDAAFRATHGGRELFGRSFRPAEGYHASVVFEGVQPDIAHYDWPARPGR